MAQSSRQDGKSEAGDAPLLFVSFFCNVKGNCPAEWADDKLRVLSGAGRDTIVLTGMISRQFSMPGVRTYRVPTLSWNDFRLEMRELRAAGVPVPLFMYFVLPFAFLFGLPFDWVMRAITKGVSSGRWSWFLLAFPVALWLKIRFGIRDIFATGGPTNAQIIGALLVKLTGGRLFIEFQDPFLGATMTRSNKTQAIARKLEAWLAGIADKTIFVTKAARDACKERTGLGDDKIVAIYPGAWDFMATEGVDGRATSEKAEDEKPSGQDFEFLHLGTLYASRNLDAFFAALDELRDEKFVSAHRVRIVNLGAVYCDNRRDYLDRSDFTELDALERVDAIHRASKATCFLLVQHSDDRSKETIPYKTYDYLNLRSPVFGVLNNDELQTLLSEQSGYASQAGNVASIKDALKRCLNDLEQAEQSGRKLKHQGAVFDISQQFLQVFE